MRVSLTPHPQSPPGPVSSIEVEVARGESHLKLTYEVFGDLDRVLLPDFTDENPGRADDLWRHTCFEAFLQPSGLEKYLEFNFATSMHWAAYQFDRYRDGMRAANVRLWEISGVIPPRALDLTVETTTGRFARPDLPAPAWRLGLSAVIEDIDGDKTYWALAHPSDKPDFHHPDSFTLVLPAPETAGTRQP